MQLRIADLQDILNRPERIREMIKADLDDVKAKFGDKRRTEISQELTDYNAEDFIDDHEIVITLSDRGYIKRLPLDTYKTQKRGGKGISATSIRTEDFSSHVVVTSVMANVLFFTNQGRVFSSKAYNLPEASRQAKGLPLINIIELRPEERVTTFIATRNFEDKRHLIMITRNGIIKKIAISAFENIRRNGLIAVNLRPDDELIGVIRIEPEDKIIVATAKGQAIMFLEEEIRPMGRVSSGVKAITLKKDNYVIGIDKYKERAQILLVTEKGYGKRIPLKEFKVQHRGGTGVKAIDISSKNGQMVACKIVFQEEDIVLLTGEGQIIRLQIDDISTQKRYSRGVLLMRLPDNDRIVSVARFRPDPEEF
jgi:DNA gyrase subunit A